MSGAIPPLPNTSSWRGAYLSTGITLPLPFTLTLLLNTPWTSYILSGSFILRENSNVIVHMKTMTLAPIVNFMQCSMKDKFVYVVVNNSMKMSGGMEIKLHTSLS
jgi:hypothetical protein